jgi:hypothetical protein
MAYINPTVEQFKLFFYRDFPYSSNPAEGVTDTDIANSYLQTNVAISEALFKGQSAYTQGYLYLSAHNLLISIQASGMGLNAFGNPGIEQSKSVGSVSQGFAIPDDYLKNPMFASLTKTRYGQIYFEMIYPFLVGRMTWAVGHTHR